MSIRTQDNKAVIFTFVIAALFLGYSVAFLGVSLSKSLIGSAGLAVAIQIGYLIKRKSAYLTNLIEQYCKGQKRKELEVAAVQAAYGQYRIALIEFKMELRNNPDNKLLKEIVSLMEDLEQ